MGEIHELFVLALSLVWFAGATPDWGDCTKRGTLALFGVSIVFVPQSPRAGRSGCFRLKLRGSYKRVSKYPVKQV